MDDEQIDRYADHRKATGKRGVGGRSRASQTKKKKKKCTMA